MKQALEKGPAQRSSFLNNYRALITAVGFLLTSLCMHAQFYDSTKLLQDVSAHGFRWKNSEFRSSLIVPTGTGLVKMANRDSGSIAYHNGIFYGNNGYAWNPIGNGAAVPTWQGTLLAPDGSILTQDNYVNAKGYNFIIDSLNYLRFENYATETVTNDPDYKISNGLELSDDINEGAHIYSSFTNNGSGLYKSELTIGSYQISLFAHDLLNDFYSGVFVLPDYISLSSNNYINLNGDSAVYLPSIPESDSSRQLATTKWTKNLVKYYPKNLLTNTTPVANVGGVETTLMSWTLPANTLINNGDYLEVDGLLTFAANGNDKEYRLNFGNADYYVTNAAQNSGSVRLKIKIIRTGASSQLITFEQLGSASSLFTPLSGYFETTEDLTTDLDIFTQATAASNNDVIQKLFTVKYIPGN